MKISQFSIQTSEMRMFQLACPSGPRGRQRRLVGIALAILMGGSALSGQSTPSVIVVNGNLARVPNVVVDGKVFVQLDEFVKAAGGTATTEGNTWVVSFASATPPIRDVAALGQIKGSLTYFFNRNFGSRPDTGSEVALLEGAVDLPSDSIVMMVPASKKLMLMRAAPKSATADLKAMNTSHEMVSYVRADGSGNFSLVDIKPGDYTLVVMSAHTNGPTLRDASHKAWIWKLTVRPGETVDASHDFGTKHF